MNDIRVWGSHKPSCLERLSHAPFSARKNGDLFGRAMRRDYTGMTCFMTSGGGCGVNTK
jgi:hypothetical protein